MSVANTPDELLSAWLDDLRKQGRSQHTIAAYRRGLEHFMRWNRAVYGQDFDPAKIIPRDVRNWQKGQQVEEKAAPATINQRLVAVSRFFHWAAKRDLAPDDPTDDVSALRLPPREPKALASRDLRRLLREARTDVRDYALLEVLAGTGIRVGELLALQVGDIESKPRSGQLTVRRGKQGGYREIPLTLDVRKALEAHLDEHPRKDAPDAPLWLAKDGSRLAHRSSVLRILEKYAIRAGIETPPPHQLRHTFATRYLKANPSDLRGLARLLGHANLNTVMIYTEPDMDDLAERMERVEAEG